MSDLVVEDGGVYRLQESSSGRSLKLHITQFVPESGRGVLSRNGAVAPRGRSARHHLLTASSASSGPGDVGPASPRPFPSPCQISPPP